jgi:hypothetical protein
MVELESCYRTGQIARLLHVSSFRIRRLAETGLIEADYSGKQWRIPGRELERLQKEGVPEIPANTGESQSPPPRPKSASGHPGLLGAPSPDLIKSAETVLATENLVKKLKLEQELAQTQEWFDKRQQEEAERLAEVEQARREQQEAEMRIAEKMERESLRRKWFEDWQQFAMNLVPWEFRDQTENEIYDAVSQVFTKLEPAENRVITERLVRNAVETVLAPLRKHKEIESVLVQVRDHSLPSGATGISELTTWQVQAVKAAGTAISQLRIDAPIEEIKAVARQAVEKIAAAFRADRGAQADAALRQQVLNLAALPTRLNEKGMNLAKSAMAAAVALLPVGTGYAELARARDGALGPFQALVTRAQQEEAKAAQEEAEARKREQAAESQRRGEEQQQQAKIEQQQAEQARRDQQEAYRLSKAQHRAGWRLSHVYDYLTRLEGQEEIEFDGFQDRWDTGQKLQEKIRPALIAELLEKPDLTDEEIRERIEGLVDQHLDEVLQPAD